MTRVGHSHGRRPTPRHLKILRGNPGKRKILDDEPLPQPGRPSRPAGIGADAEGEWDRLAHVLELEGRLHLSDGPHLLAVAIAYQTMWEWVHRGKKATKLADKLQCAREARQQRETYRQGVNDLCLSQGTRSKAKTTDAGQAATRGIGAFLARRPGSV